MEVGIDIVRPPAMDRLLQLDALALHRAQAVAFEWNHKEETWDPLGGEEWADVHILEDPSGTYRIIASVRSTGEQIVNMQISSASLWCHLADDFMEFAADDFEVVAFCFVNIEEAQQTTEVVLSVFRNVGVFEPFLHQGKYVPLPKLPTDVSSWLRTLELSRYLAVFKVHGICSVECLPLLTPEELDAMEVRRKHKRTLLRAIEQIRLANFRENQRQRLLARRNPKEEDRILSLDDTRHQFGEEVDEGAALRRDMLMALGQEVVSDIRRREEERQRDAHNRQVEDRPTNNAHEMIIRDEESFSALKKEFFGHPVASGGGDPHIEVHQDNNEREPSS